MSDELKDLLKRMLEKAIGGMEAEIIAQIKLFIETDPSAMTLFYGDMTTDMLLDFGRGMLFSAWDTANLENAEWIQQQRAWLLEALLILIKYAK